MSSKSPKSGSASSSSGDASRRRNIILASVVGVAVVAVALIIILGSGGGSGSKNTAGAGGKVQGTKENKDLLGGIPQKGRFLGNPKAKVTLIEFADLQCPFCRQYALSTFPVLVNDYVRPGKLRMELRTLSFIGPDSQVAAQAGAAAGVQNKEWTYTDLFYRNQGQENTGYVTDQFLDKLFKASGMNVTKANEFRKTALSKVPLNEANAAAEKYGVVSTPTFLIGTTGGPYEKLDVAFDNPAGLKAAIDSLLK